MGGGLLTNESRGGDSEGRSVKIKQIALFQFDERQTKLQSYEMIVQEEGDREDS